VAFQCTIVHLEREIHFLERQQSTAAHFERFGTGRREQSGRKIAVAPPARFYSRLSPICSLAYPPPRLGVRFWKVLEGCVDELCSLRARSTRSGRARSTRSGATGWKRVVLRATVAIDNIVAALEMAAGQLVAEGATCNRFRSAAFVA
jgi:hypothetical protein